MVFGFVLGLVAGVVLPNEVPIAQRLYRSFGDVVNQFAVGQAFGIPQKLANPFGIVRLRPPVANSGHVALDVDPDCAHRAAVSVLPRSRPSLVVNGDRLPKLESDYLRKVKTMDVTGVGLV